MLPFTLQSVLTPWYVIHPQTMTLIFLLVLGEIQSGSQDSSLLFSYVNPTIISNDNLTLIRENYFSQSNLTVQILLLAHRRTRFTHLPYHLFQTTPDFIWWHMSIVLVKHLINIWYTRVCLTSVRAARSSASFLCLFLYYFFFYQNRVF